MNWSSFTEVQKQGDDHAVYGPETKFGKFLTLFRPYIDNIPAKYYKGGVGQSFTPAQNFTPAIVPGKALKRMSLSGADIIHLHWIGKGYIPIEGLSNLRNMPVVHVENMQVMHDLT